MSTAMSSLALFYLFPFYTIVFISRGQNIEFRRETRRTDTLNPVQMWTDITVDGNSGEGIIPSLPIPVAGGMRLADCVVLSGEYCVPLHSVEGHQNSDRSSERMLAGATHEHFLTLEELMAPPDVHVAMTALTGKIDRMYPAMLEDGWKVSACHAGE